MRKPVLIAVAVACLIGAAIAAVSTSQYLRIQREGLEQKSFCAVSDVIDCDISNASSYSTFAGVPVSSFGLVAYLLIGGMAIFGAVSKKEQKATVTIAWFVSILAVLYSVRMAYILVGVLGVACIECISMYTINIFVAIALWIALRIPVKGVGSFFIDYAKAVFRRPSNLGFTPKIFSHAVIVMVALGMCWIIMYSAQGRGGEKGVTLKEKINAHYMQSLYAIEPDPTWPVWGNPYGKVTIIEFSDFECPFCRLAAFNIRPYLQEFRKNVRYYFVNYPLDQACNPYMGGPMHRNACMAAAAVECAWERGDFWGFHDDLFRISRNLNRENILKLAAKRQWDEEEFQTCMDSEETKERILSQIEAARKIHISGTPSIIINGRRLKYWRDKDFLQAIIKREVARQ